MIIQHRSVNGESLLDSVIPHKQAKIQEELLESTGETREKATIAPAQDPGHFVEPSLMARNFVTADGQESRYISAAKTSLETARAMVRRQNAILNAALAELNALDNDGENYAGRYLVGKQAARRVYEERQHAALEESRKNLEEIKDNLDQKAEAALAGEGEETNGEQVSVNAGDIASLPQSSRAPVSAEATAPAPDTRATASSPSPVDINITI